jgi:hypothetical protein
MGKSLVVVMALLHLVATSSSAYVETAGMNCYGGHGAMNIDNGNNATIKSLSECKAFCDATANCDCVVYESHATPSSKCFRRAGCQRPEECEKDEKWNAYVKPAPPTPPPTPAPPAPTPGPACTDCPNILFMFTDDQVDRDSFLPLLASYGNPPPLLWRCYMTRTR